jgi:hypothetical protein
MTRNRYGGIGLPDADFDVELAVEVEGDDEEVVEKVAMAAREGGVRALQAFDTGKHPEECDGVPVSIDWESVLEARDPKGSTGEDGEEDPDSDE